MGTGRDLTCARVLLPFIPPPLNTSVFPPAPLHARPLRHLLWCTWTGDERSESRPISNASSPARPRSLPRLHTLPAGYTTHHTNLDLEEFTSGVLHSAVLDELEPASTYFYRVGDAERGLSTVRNFTTPGVLGAEQPLVLGILGDLGQTNDSRCVDMLMLGCAAHASQGCMMRRSIEACSSG